MPKICVKTPKISTSPNILTQLARFRISSTATSTDPTPSHPLFYITPVLNNNIPLKLFKLTMCCLDSTIAL